MSSSMRPLILSSEGESLGFLGVLKLAGERTGGSLAVVEHLVPPGALMAPPHTHSREDEFSLVLEGEIGVLLDDQSYDAPRGTYILKPRGIPHTFWNATRHPARVLEIVAPAGFERYFAEINAIVSTPGTPDVAAIMRTAERYGLVLHMDRLAEVQERFGVSIPG